MAQGQGWAGKPLEIFAGEGLWAQNGTPEQGLRRPVLWRWQSRPRGAKLRVQVGALPLKRAFVLAWTCVSDSGSILGWRPEEVPLWVSGAQGPAPNSEAGSPISPTPTFHAWGNLEVAYRIGLLPSPLGVGRHPQVGQQHQASGRKAE